MTSVNQEVYDLVAADEDNLQPIHVWADTPESILTQDDCIQLTRLQVFQSPSGCVPPKVTTGCKDSLASQSMDVYYYYYGDWPDMTAPSAESLAPIRALVSRVTRHVEELGGPDNCDLLIHWYVLSSYEDVRYAVPKPCCHLLTRCSSADVQLCWSWPYWHLYHNDTARMSTPCIN